MDFDEIYGRADELYFPRASSWIVTLAAELPAGRALDVGCGDGRNALHLLQRGWDVDAVDVARAGLAKLTAHAERCGKADGLQVFASDAHSFLASAGGPYDMVIASAVLDHLPAMTTRDVADAIWRVLTHGAFVYASAFLVGDDASDPDSSRPGPTAFGVRRLFEPDELPTLFPEAVTRRYVESVEEDLSHGSPHWHHVARYIGQKVVA